MSNILRPKFPAPLRYQPINDAKWLYRIRNWLIQRLAGKSVVILNAEIDFVDPEGGERMVVKDCVGAVVVDCMLPSVGGMVPRIRPYVTVKSGQS